MDDITEILDEAATHAGPYTFDVDRLIADTRSVRRRRSLAQVGGGAVAVVAVIGASLGLARSPSHTPGSSPGSVTTSAAPVAVHTFATGPAPLRTKPSPIPTRPLPNGLENACGKPGSQLIVRIVPVTIPHRICNLSGVNILTAAGNRAAVSTDPRTGDVTIERPR